MDYQGFAVGMLEIACNFSPSCEARGEAQWLDQLLVRLQRKREVAAAAGVNAVHENQPARMAAGNEVFSEPRCGGHSPEEAIGGSRLGTWLSIVRRKPTRSFEDLPHLEQTTWSAGHGARDAHHRNVVG